MSVLTLAWMYANPRDWNPYAGDPALLARLDAALDHYLDFQLPDGAFDTGRDLARVATGFGLFVLTATLHELLRAEALPQTRDRILSALRKAAEAGERA